MLFKLVGDFRDLEVTEREPHLSRSTGVHLRRISVSASVGDALTDPLDEELNAARSTDEEAIEDSDGKLWTVEGWTSSFNSGGTTTYQVDLVEREVVQARSISFGDMTFSVVHYSEDLRDDDGPLVIEAEVTATDAEVSAILDLYDSEDQHYFLLVRHGVSDEPIPVRFGRMLWQPAEDSTRRLLITLVSEDGDDESRRDGLSLLYEPQMSNVNQLALTLRETVEGLLNELQKAGVLSEEAQGRIRARAGKAWERQWFDLAETSHLEDYRN